MPNPAVITLAVTVKGRSWTSTQNRDIITAAAKLIEIHPLARVDNLSVTTSPKGLRTAMRFILEQEL